MRTVREKDLKQLYDLLNDAHNRGRWYPIRFESEPKFYKEYHETGFWGCNGLNRLVVVDINDDDKILGLVTYFKSVPYFDGVEVAFILFDTESRGKGMGTQVLDSFCGVVFNETKVNRLEARQFPPNEASKKTMEKVGWKFEGVARQCVIQKEGHVDLNCWSLIRKEFYQRRDKNSII